MKCWRTFDFERRYGTNKILIYSLLLTMLFFSFSFALMQSLFSKTLYSGYFHFFLIALLAIYPLHKLVHLLPILHYWRQMKCRCKMTCFCMPIISINIKQPVPKRTFMVSLLLPFFTINPALLICGMLFPHYIHYFTMLTAFHMGMCAIDLLYLKAMAASPKYAVIEEHDRGYEILIPQ
ncbi:hypothetical protein AC623_03545 [Bacillus sp. FJAT-27231]|uniref:DUF3267 domain-containing protein n=1 Tax=Bacillus sp. FJAT-27231 TaxID=1679168 RepID=UPI0006711738|nr:DUF3267 domain-containing protein [Bacillus sp. FJAT-27231]KMY53170.1 hypothetical protein AC623_03545 [Bacillus sp. FJAT-27231]